MNPENLSWVYGLLGLVNSTVSTGRGLTQQIVPYQSPSAPSAYSSPSAAIPGRSCYIDHSGWYQHGTFEVVVHADGSRTVECVPNTEGGQR